MSLSPRPFDLLVALATNPGRLLSRDELLQTVWKNTAVEQSSLNAAMSVLRQALGDEAAAIIDTARSRAFLTMAKTFLWRSGTGDGPVHATHVTSAYGDFGRSRRAHRSIKSQSSRPMVRAWPGRGE